MYPYRMKIYMEQNGIEFYTTDSWAFKKIKHQLIEINLNRASFIGVNWVRKLNSIGSVPPVWDSLDNKVGLALSCPVLLGYHL